MRKYIVGFIVGLLFASAFPVYGAVTSTVGKKVEVEYPVIVDGKQLDKKAVAIDGVSYTPNSLLGSAAGYDVAFENKTVVFSRKPGDPVHKLKESISLLNGQLFHISSRYNYNDPIPPEVQAKLDDLKTQIAELEAVKAELESATPTP